MGDASWNVEVDGRRERWWLGKRRQSRFTCDAAREMQRSKRLAPWGREDALRLKEVAQIFRYLLGACAVSKMSQILAFRVHEIDQRRVIEAVIAGRRLIFCF